MGLFWASCVSDNVFVLYSEKPAAHWLDLCFRDLVTNQMEHQVMTVCARLVIEGWTKLDKWLTRRFADVQSNNLIYPDNFYCAVITTRHQSVNGYVEVKPCRWGCYRVLVWDRNKFLGSYYVLYQYFSYNDAYYNELLRHLFFQTLTHIILTVE